MEKSVVTDHSGDILSMMNLNKRFIVTSSKDRTLKIYDLRNTYTALYTLKGHKNPATYLCKIHKLGVDVGSNPMPFYLLASDDPQIKVWDLSYSPPRIVMTLSGHSERITDIKPLTLNLAVSSSLDNR
jgi:WD40 repeat protein